MPRFLVYWFTTTLALWVSDMLLAGVHVSTLPVLFVAGFVLGFVNTIVRPVLVILTLPITIVTLGLFYLIVNGLAFALAAALVPGFGVDSLLSAVGGALVVGVVSWFVGLFVEARSDRRV